jgi:hypothetical protein
VRLVLALLATVATQGACQRTERTSSATDCARVAETLTSFEVGTAATPEQRTPVVAKHRAACESTKVTADEAACLGKATDTWAARACLPRMFAAASATGSTAGCAMFVTRMREAVMTEVGSQGSAAAEAIDQMLPVIRQSCEQDVWPAAVLDCVGRSKPGDMTALQTCANQLPQQMQEKMAQRLMAQQRAQEPAQPQPPQPQPPQPK